MKKILYILIGIISLVTFNQTVEAATSIDNLGRCYYKDSENNVKLYAWYFDGDGPLVNPSESFTGEFDGTFHNAGSSWIIENWTKDTKKVSKYESRDENCPPYIIYVQNKSALFHSGDDEIYFSDKKLNLKEDENSKIYYLENYDKSSQAQVEDPKKCEYEATSGFLNKKIKLSVDPRNEKYFWYIDDTFASDTPSFDYNGYSLQFNDSKFSVDGKDYSFKEYYSEKNMCPSYDFEEESKTFSIVLSPTGHSVDGSIDTEEIDTEYKAEFECEIELDESIYLKFQKGAIDGKVYGDKVCVKYEENAYQCFNEWNDGVKLDEYTHISFKNEETVNYFKKKHLESGHCPTVSSGEISVQKNTDDFRTYYMISTKQENLSTKFTSSQEFRTLLGKLKNPLEALKPETLNYKIRIDSSETEIGSVPSVDDICKRGECSEPDYQTQKGLAEIKSYCIRIQRYNKNKYDATSLNKRIEECESFDNFYNQLVSEGIISPLESGCEFITEDLHTKIHMILDIIKIAGPILAIILGMLDFTKVLVSGDADKEMKTAWKNFKVRLFAAFLLFIIPIFISLLLNMFIGDKINNNPYCGLFDVNESE